MKFLKPSEFYGTTRFIDSSLYLTDDPSIYITIDASELAFSDYINGHKPLSELGKKVQADYAQTDSTADSFILNKPEEKTFNLKKYLSNKNQSTNFRFTVPSSYKINTLEIKEKAGSPAGYISIGNVDSSNNVVNSEYIDASSLVKCAVGKEVFSLTDDVYLYITSSNWGSGVIDLNIHLDKLIW